VYVWGEDEVGNVIGFNEDNSVLYITSSVGSNTTRVLGVNAADSSIEVVAEDPDHDVRAEVLTRNTGSIQAVNVLRDRREWRLIDETLAEHFEYLRQFRDAEFQICHRDEIGRRWVIISYSDESW